MNLNHSGEWQWVIYFVITSLREQQALITVTAHEVCF